MSLQKLFPPQQVVWKVNVTVESGIVTVKFKLRFVGEEMEGSLSQLQQTPSYYDTPQASQQSDKIDDDDTFVSYRHPEWVINTNLLVPIDTTAHFDSAHHITGCRLRSPLIAQR